LIGEVSHRVEAIEVITAGNHVPIAIDDHPFPGPFAPVLFEVSFERNTFPILIPGILGSGGEKLYT
jgi:hypothetical protein